MTESEKSIFNEIIENPKRIRHYQLELNISQIKLVELSGVSLFWLTSFVNNKKHRFHFKEKDTIQRVESIAKVFNVLLNK